MSLCVVLLELFGELLCDAVALCGEEFDAAVGVTDTTGGVEAWGEAVADGAFTDHLAVEVDSVEERGDATAMTAAQDLEAEFDEDTVFVAQGDNVCDRAETDEVEIVVQVGGREVVEDAEFLEVLIEREDEVECDTNSGQLREREAVFGELWIDDEALRQAVGDGVVIDDDGVDALRAEPGDLIKA